MMRNKTEHLFSLIPKVKIPRSSFNRSHGWKSTFSAGQLVPFYLDEVLPGDTFNCSANIFARLSSMVAPVMDNAYLDVFFFYVPTRLIWRHWKEFNGETIVDGIQTTDYSVPQMTALVPSNDTEEADNILFGTIWDYLGLPVWSPSSDDIKLSVSALPFRAVWKIYNDWFRDENLQDCLNITTGTAVTSVTSDVEQDMLGDDEDVSFPFQDGHILYRGKRHDYFTSALPWPQKGPSVGLSLGGTANVTTNTSGIADFSNLNVDVRLYQPEGIVNGSSSTVNLVTSLTSLDDTYRTVYADVDENNIGSSSGNVPATFTKLVTYGSGTITDVNGLVADLSNTTALTINSLRQAFALQQFYERDARGGSRYTEIIRSHFGVVSPDARLQRSEFLGGSSTPIDINSVAQTSATTTETPQANLAAFGVVGSQRTGFNKSFTEHGYVVGFLNVRTDLSYQQGINKLWSRKSRVEFYWPEFANLGEQAILNKEIYAQGTDEDDEVFGYQERYAEYRYHPSLITGALRSADPTSLDVWHFGQQFNSLPQLNSEFISDYASRNGIKRAVAVQDEPQFIVDAYIRLKCARPMPVYGVPGLTHM